MTTTTDPSASFCVLPWLHLFADEAGTVWPCCRTIGARQPASDADGRPLGVADPGGPAAALDGVSMRALRRDMLDGIRPAACERCYMVEDLGMRSHRQDENARWAADIPALVAATGTDGALTVDIRTADLRLGNLCNLRCRMCSPQSSRLLIPEWAARFGLDSDDTRLDPFRRPDWFENPAFWAGLEKMAPRLERINFAGGEPFLIEPMFTFLERMVASGRAPAMTISYNTNLTLLPDRLTALWPRFRAIRVTVSLDGAGPVNDFIRHPSRWAAIDANLRRLDENAHAWNLGAGLGVNTAVQVLNVFDLGRLIDHVATHLPRFAAPNLTIVTHPDHLNLRLLPRALKDLARDRLTRARRSAPLWHDRWGPAAARLDAAIDGIVEHMDSADHGHLQDQFLTWTRHQDRWRGQDTARVIPELAPLFAPSPA